jgi:hypothetical protein
MGLLPPVILGALLIVAFALSAQQRLGLASHAAPMPARQIAYVMRAHHQGAIGLKQATPGLQTVIDAPPPTMSVGDDLFLSCISGKFVATSVTTMTPLPTVKLQSAAANAVVAELARQSILVPELGRTGWTPLATGYNNSPLALTAPAPGVGLSDGTNIHTTAGLIPIPPDCVIPSGAPTLITQVVP